MHKIGLFTAAFLVIFSISSCSKKNHPSGTTVTSETTVPPVTTPPAENTTIKKRPLITAIPKMIAVNDKAAKRSVDGRYYYDLNGHCYWRNNKDGKYYLFHKAMFDDDAFKSPGL